MIRHPARHYIYYMFSKRGLGIEQVCLHLDDLRLPLPQDEKVLDRFMRSLVRTRREMNFPPGFDPLAESPNAETQAFLTKWQISDIWRQDPFVGLAVDLLEEPIIRRMMEALLLGPLSPAAIADRIKHRFGLTEAAMNVRVVRAFAHYFWDIAALSMPEWRTLIATWLPDKNNNDYLAALTSPRTPAGAALTLALVDRSAESLNPVAQYTAFRDMAFSMFMEHALLQSQPSLPRSQGAFMTFQLVKMADEELTKHQGGSAELLEEFKRIQTMYDASRITSVKDLPALAPAIIDVEPVIDEPLTEPDEDKEIA